jgi:hypothetical protein
MVQVVAIEEMGAYVKLVRSFYMTRLTNSSNTTILKE